MQPLTNLQLKLEAFSQKNSYARFLVTVICSPLFWILLVCAILRGIYYSVLLTTSAYDTAGYVNYKANILLGQTEALRTPVYPYFIKLIGFFDSSKNLLD